jgi:hypothetical protein
MGRRLASKTAAYELLRFAGLRKGTGTSIEATGGGRCGAPTMRRVLLP